GGGAGRLSHRPGGEAGDVGGRSARRTALPHRGAVHRAHGTLPHAATAQRRAEAPPAPASARVGGVQPAGDDPLGGPEGYRGPVLLVLRSRGGTPLGRRL